MTILFVGLFRLNGALLAAGDRLVGNLGLTSARWQVIGVVANSSVPLPVASIARNMGLTRQGVRVVVNDLAATGLVRFVPNPHHRKAHLVMLTPEGESVHRAAKERWLPWTNQLGRGLSRERIEDAVELLQMILLRLEENSPGTAESHID